MPARIVPDLDLVGPRRSVALPMAVFGSYVAIGDGRIVTAAGGGGQGVEPCRAREIGTGAEVAMIPTDVDDLDAALAAARTAGADISRGPVTEPRGVRRSYLTDPDGHVGRVFSQPD